MTRKKKTGKLYFIKNPMLLLEKKKNKNTIDQLKRQSGLKYLQIMYLIRDLYPTYIFKKSLQLNNKKTLVHVFV